MDSSATTAVPPTAQPAPAGSVPPTAQPAPAAPGAGLAVATHDLTKVFADGGAQRTVVSSLDLAVPRGTVYGFLGPNGSGKSTTMKMLLGLLSPTRGEIALLGEPLTRATRGRIIARTGSLIEQPPGYGHLTGAENMRIVQRMLALSDAQVARALDLVRLTEHRDRLVRTYSLGMKQRLGIAIALAREPELLVLDEPTNGLDPSGTEEVRRLLVHLAGEGVTVMVSSHLLDEIDRMAGVLGILSAGHLVFQGSRQELLARSAPDLVLTTPEPERALRELRALPGLAGADGSAPGVRATPGSQEVRVTGTPPDAVAHLVQRLALADVPLTEVRREVRRLEDVFIDLTGRGGAL